MNTFPFPDLRSSREEILLLWKYNLLLFLHNCDKVKGKNTFTKIIFKVPP